MVVDLIIFSYDIGNYQTLMTLYESLIQKILPDSWRKFEKEADFEVGLAKKMALTYCWGSGQPERCYYNQRSLFDGIVELSDEFLKNDFMVHPYDLFSILFRCKMLYASTTEDEFVQRSWWFFAFRRRDIYDIISWKNKSHWYEILITEAINSLESEIYERRLLTSISWYRIMDHLEEKFSAQNFLNDLFQELGINTKVFLQNPTVDNSNKYYWFNGFNQSYDTQDKIDDFFRAPSISYGIKGSEMFCFKISSTILVNILNLLRIFSFIRPAQIMFWENDIPFLPPEWPVFMWWNSYWCFYWEQDKQDPWNKVPDWNIFTSFWFRTLNYSWLDYRIHESMREFFISNQSILQKVVSKTWDNSVIKVIYPVLDLLNSATQITDLWAKLLLIYCSLEHLFVPKWKDKENDKYILWWINALDTSLVPWFIELYGQRNRYAHKGYIINDKENKWLNFIQESMNNVVKLLNYKVTLSEK